MYRFGRVRFCLTITSHDFHVTFNAQLLRLALYILSIIFLGSGRRSHLVKTGATTHPFCTARTLEF